MSTSADYLKIGICHFKTEEFGKGNRPQGEGNPKKNGHARASLMHALRADDFAVLAAEQGDRVVRVIWQYFDVHKGAGFFKHLSAIGG